MTMKSGDFTIEMSDTTFERVVAMLSGACTIVGVSVAKNGHNLLPLVKMCSLIKK